MHHREIRLKTGETRAEGINSRICREPSPASPTNTWYERADDPQTNLSAMIQPSAHGCTAYLFADRTTDAHDASPLGGG